jgi:hypothetical protein
MREDWQELPDTESTEIYTVDDVNTRLHVINGIRESCGIGDIVGAYNVTKTAGAVLRNSSGYSLCRYCHLGIVP